MLLLIEEYLSLASSLGYLIYDEGYCTPNIVGVRSRNSRVNHYDDSINLYYIEEGKWQHKMYAATTYPGLPSLLKPPNPKGTAILKPGQYIDTYAIGKHRGKYDALVQVAPVTVYRDSNLDDQFTLDPSKKETGLFGINIHRASFGAKFVGPDSAGCQVIKYADDFNDFMYHVKLASTHNNNKFTYTLVEV